MWLIIFSNHGIWYTEKSNNITQIDESSGKDVIITGNYIC